MYNKDSHDFHISVHKLSPAMLEELQSDRFRVVIFGSARITSNDQAYTHVFDLARKIGEAGFDIVTGGGPGVMEAANLGHRVGTPGEDNQARSIGLNIRLPMEQHANPNLDIEETHERFSTRLDEFMMLSNIVVMAEAGGIGSLLELFYTWQLIQVHHICKMPIVLVGDMWSGLIEWIKKEPLKNLYLSPEDLDCIVQVKNSDEAFEVIMKTYKEHKKNGKNACLNSLKYQAKSVAK